MIKDNEWLVVIDRQKVFAQSEWSRWACPDRSYYATDANCAKLAKAYGDHVVYTRYIAPIPPTGAWVDYFKEWPEFLVSPDDVMYNFTDDTAALADGHPVVSRATFGKWGNGLEAAIGGSNHIAVCGVATDCCVLQTVLPAADDGMHVRVVADACAGSSAENHQLALNTMRLFSPMVEVTDTTSMLG